MDRGIKHAYYVFYGCTTVEYKLPVVFLRLGKIWLAYPTFFFNIQRQLKLYLTFVLEGFAEPYRSIP